MKELELFDTMQQTKRKLVPLEAGRLGLYVCGVTVYDLCHIGHARSQVAFDVIQRTLRQFGYNVNYVRNFTDVDDKIIRRAQEQQISWKEVAERNIDFFYRDMDALGIQRPQIEPKVSDHIPEIIDSVSQIISNGYGYEIDGDVYFAVKDCPWYGELSGRKLDDMEAGSRVEIDQRKRHPMDFALWKSAKPGEPHWPSPWGNGRPGWHIECSVMSTLFLGPNFDIHGGGRDLIFPHHENERAQALAHRTDSKFACCWLHNGFVNIGGEKMAKSLGNFFTIEELLRRFTGETLRYYLLNTQYRNPINFELQIATCLKEQETMTPEKLRAATQFPGLEEAARRVHYYYDTLNRIDETLRDKNLESTDTNETFEQITNAQNLFWQAIADDFNTPAAIGSYSGLLRTANDLIVQASEPKALRTLSHIRETLLKLGQMLGLMELEPQTYLASERDCCLQYIGVACAEIEKLIAERKAARAARDWKRADEIRESLRKQGIIICDNPQGTTWTVSN